MKISDYYAEKYYAQYNNSDVASASSTGAAATSFQNVLAGQQQAEETAAAAVTGKDLADALGNQQLTTGVGWDSAQQVKARVQDVDLEETYGLVLGTGLTPEAAQKKEELEARLEALCANNPGVYYRLSEEIYQKMADDPEFEANVYKAIDTFEQSTAAKVTLSGDTINAMYVGPEGDWLMMSSIMGGEDDKDSVWEIILHLRSGKTSVTLEELRELFPNMLPSTAEKIVKNQDTQPAANDTTGEEAPADSETPVIPMPEAVAI